MILITKTSDQTRCVCVCVCVFVSVDIVCVCGSLDGCNTLHIAAHSGLVTIL